MAEFDRLFAGRLSVRSGVLGLLMAGLFAAAASFPCAWPAGSIAAAQAASNENPYPQRIPAPPLEGGTDWVNLVEPLELSDLRGRFVLLDFWTYCCINCIHILPELKKLEQAFPEELVVIGVHSGKFAQEKDSENIRQAIGRYEIEHPVVNDAELAIWRRYGVRAWPTFVLIDPVGDVVWAASGERKFEDIKQVIDQGLPFYRRQGLLQPAPPPALVVDETLGQTPLRYPGKVLADEAGDRLFISDSNHHRIVVAKLDGTLEFTIGSGESGREDGAFDTCRFNRPQGMALVGDVLYVADTENHMLRKADLVQRAVTTVAGTGEQGTGWPGWRPGNIPRRFLGSPRQTALASPWALWAHEDDLYIAMAGPHQIWRMPLGGRRMGPYAGNGREDVVDGPLLPKVPYEMGFASLAQPSGLASDGQWLFVADSEGSAIRAVPLNPRGNVETLVGPVGTLFDFGDRDGVGREVRLQHPLGVAYYEGMLYVADTYNNKIKAIDVVEQRCRTIAGTGEAGAVDAAEGAAATFNEPGGLTVADGRLYVADTNNHLIRVVELAAPYGVSTIEVQGLAAP